MTSPLIHLVCGSTGAGKTTYSMELASKIGGMRFSIDEWMTALFWMDSPEPIEFEWAMERINRCEEQIWAMAEQLAKCEVPSILDLGLTKKKHRTKFADLAAKSELPLELHFLDVPLDERWRRVEHRNQEKGATYRLEVTRTNFDFVERMWEPPTDEEMAALNGVRVGDE